MRRAPLYALWVADSISLVGNVVAQLAIPWFVLITTDSPTLTGPAVFFNFLPTVLELWQLMALADGLDAVFHEDW